MKHFLLFLTLALAAGCTVEQRPTAPPANTQVSEYQEPYRPQFHFSPKQMWMNDPNGMVYHDGVYHLFFQQDPTKIVTGNLHWGHATSRDLVRWEQQPTALAPDQLGLIFSGSAVVDAQNTAGLGQEGKTPLVALYTSHNVEQEKQGRTDYETQSLAYSLDGGQTWTKYANNPVLKNPGQKDFRDPKVMWHEPTRKWIMALAVKDRIHFYSSPNLKEWTKESEFGVDKGAHGGVWECPDLFALSENNRERWVLFVSINPGGPNGGSATQYFVGDFDGKNFTSAQTDTKWVDWGTDNYAGVTWSNTAPRRIFIGWMSNWLYGQKVPTAPWRSAMTVPRELNLTTVSGNEARLVSRPVPELDKLSSKTVTLENINVQGDYNLTEKVNNPTGRFRLKFNAAQTSDWSVVLSNQLNEQIVIGFNRADNSYYVDRTKSGKIDFDPNFAQVIKAPRVAVGNETAVDLLVDAASLELFADNGLTVLTGIFFPNQPLSGVNIKAPAFNIARLEYSNMESIWAK